MTNLNSVSDLARSYQLRVSQTSLKSKLEELSRESTTGIKADIPQALDGDLDRINQIESRLVQLGTHSRNLAEAQSVLNGMQNSIGQIQSRAAATGTLLLSEALISSDTALMLQIDKAPDEMRAVLSALNVSVGSRFVFSGTRFDQPAISGYDDLMAQVTLAVGGSTDPATILAAIDGYFDAAPGGGGFIDNGYQGSQTGSNFALVDTDRKLGTDINAGSDQLRDALKGFAIISYASQNKGLGATTLRELTRAAGMTLVNSENQLTLAASAIGVQQESAGKLSTTNVAESSALKIARNALIAADPYERAAALKEVEANIETIYTLTARLSKLSLMDYL